MFIAPRMSDIRLEIFSPNVSRKAKCMGLAIGAGFDIGSEYFKIKIKNPNHIEMQMTNWGQKKKTKHKTA